jgi:hypothetical protein
MSGKEARKGIPGDAVMAAWQTESRQAPAAYPAQDSGIADAAAPGDKSDGNVFRRILFE